MWPSSTTTLPIPTRSLPCLRSRHLWPTSAIARRHLRWRWVRPSSADTASGGSRAELGQSRGDDLGCGLHRLHVLRRVVQFHQIDVDPVVTLADEDVAVLLIGLITDAGHRRELVAERVAIDVEFFLRAVAGDDLDLRGRSVRVARVL